ncbi:hypothetical protein GCM10010198_44750 [Nocardia seriolae]|nr:hypothetical protein NSERKGN1266_59990 [Nocardia seriolae]GEM25537.1 hypothetical protein NS2_37760 [Nocardia seriolae NBRC 15557]
MLRVRTGADPVVIADFADHWLLYCPITVYGDLIATEILTPARILEAVLNGEHADRLSSPLSRHVGEFLELQTGPARPLVMLVAGDSYTAIERDAVTFVLDHVKAAAHAGFDRHAIEALDVRNLAIEKPSN